MRIVCAVLIVSGAGQYPQEALVTNPSLIQCRDVLIPVDPEIISDKVSRRLRSQHYECDEIDGLSRFVTADDRVLELGSGIGFVSSYLAKTIGVSQITCVEANHLLCAFAAKVHEVNGVTGIQVLNAVACSDAQPSGQVPFYVTTPFWSSSLRRPSKMPYTEVAVTQTPLSELIAKTRPTVLVLDIEGGEADLFDDVNIGEVRWVFMELHTRSYGGRGVVKVFEHMHRQGFFYHQRFSCGGIVVFERLHPVE